MKTKTIILLIILMLTGSCCCCHKKPGQVTGVIMGGEGAVLGHIVVPAKDLNKKKVKILKHESPRQRRIRLRRLMKGIQHD